MAKWCGCYGCFCNEVQDITDYNNHCDMDCEDCEHYEEVIRLPRR